MPGEDVGGIASPEGDESVESERAFVLAKIWGVKYQALSLLLLVVVIVESALLVASYTQPSPASGALATAGPPSIPLPPGSVLTRTENLISEGSRSWYYSVPNSSEANLLAFYQTRLTRDAWICLAAMASTNIQREGQPVSGTGEYITAVRGQVKVEIDSGTLDYGSEILGDHIDPGAVALRITLEAAASGDCPMG